MKLQFTFYFVFAICSLQSAISQSLSYTTQITNNTSCGCNYTGKKVVINQFCVTPTLGNGSIFGNDGQSPIQPNMWNGEWIELYNPSPCSSTDISNYIIGTTINNNALSFLIPPGTIIPPRGFAIIRGNKAPIPPAGTIDILVNNTNNICTEHPNDYFWLPGEGGLGGWFCLYSNTGIPLDAVEYGPQWPFNTKPPCNPPGNTLPNGTILAPLTQVRTMSIFKDFHTGAIPPNFNSLGRTYFRTPDGGVWNNAQSSSDLQPENTSYGSCNDPAICLQPEFACNGSITINMTSGSAPYTYNWLQYPTNTSNSATGLCAGTYTVNVTDATNISESITVTIIDENFNLNATIINASCNQSNGSIHLSPEGAGPFTYTWTPNISNTNIATNLGTGTYHVNVFNGSCTSDTIITIQPSIGVNVDINLTPVSCLTNTGTATSICTGGTQPYSILWNTLETNNTITVTGPNTYTISVTDAAGCISRDTIIVLAPIRPTTNANSNSPICSGNTLNLTASNSSLTNSSFSWSGPNNFSSTSQNISIPNAQLNFEGQYIVKVANGDCYTTDTIEVIVNPTPITNASSNSPICFGKAVTLFAENTNNFNVSFSWAGPLGYNSTIQNPTIMNSTLEMNGKYIVKISANNCFTTDTLDIVINPIPTANIISNNPICEGKTIELTANSVISQNLTFLWTGPNGFISTEQNPIINSVLPSSSGYYSLVTKLNGCQDSTSLFVNVNSFPDLNFTSTINEGCQPLIVTFNNTSTPITTNSKWNFGDGNFSTENQSTSHVFKEIGKYSIELIAELNGCVDTLIKNNFIEVHPNASALFNTDKSEATVEDPTFHFINDSENATTYDWNFGANIHSNQINPTYSFIPEPGYHEVILIANNEYNCPDTFMTTIQIIEPLIFYIPNTFTPDGNEFNQVFKPVFTSGFDKDDYNLTIFDRWGAIIFESEDHNVGWDGSFNGNLAQDGTYVWTITFKDANNDKKYYQNGHVNLLK